MTGCIASQATRCLIAVMVLAAVAGFLRPAAAEDRDQPLAMYYIQRAPYYEKQADGRAGGFLVEITRLVLQKARVSHRLVEAPPMRILALLKQNVPAGSIGWFKTPSREKFARFSRPIYQNQPLCIVTTAENASHLPADAGSADLFREDWELGTISGFSYGAWADELMRKHNPKRRMLSVEVEHLLRMIDRSRIDYTFMAPEEAHALLRKHSDLGARLRIRRLSDAPPGNLRYLMFSRAVEAQTMEQINQAIVKVKKSEAYRALIRFGPD